MGKANSLGCEWTSVNWYPPYVPDSAVSDVLERMKRKRAESRMRYDEYATAIEADDFDDAVVRKREYQLARYHLRQIEGEFVWIALGHAIEDLAREYDPNDDAVLERGTAFSKWVTNADRLRTIESERRLELIVARRSPTLPATHADYVESMFQIDSEHVGRVRKRDRELLAQSGWERTGRPASEPVVTVACPQCGGSIAVRSPRPDDVVIRAEFSDDDVMREICPHCDSDVFVARPGT
jgi:hypothetical protein